MSSGPAELITTSSGIGLLERFRQLFARRETIRYLVSSQLKAGHRDKVLGHLWNLLDPLLFMLVYFFVFGVLFGVMAGKTGRSFEFMLYILSGLITFRFVSGTVNEAANCVRSNRGLIHEINFPKAVFPTAVVFSRLYDFLWGLLVLVVFLLIAGHWPSLHYVWLPVLIGVMVVFTAGAAYVVAYLGALYADTHNVVQVGMRLLFYVSPVFYFVRDHAPYKAMIHNPHILFVYMLNPLACLFECSRDVLLWGQSPDKGMLLYSAGVAVVVYIVGFAIFTRGEGKFAKYI